MSKINELRDGLAYVSALLLDLDERAGDAELSDSDQASFDAGIAWVETARAELAREEARAAKREELRELAAIPGAREGEAETVNRSFHVNVRTDVFDVERDASPRDLIARAHTIAEKHAPAGISDEQKASMVRTAEKEPTRAYDAELVNRHIIESSRPEVIESFREFWRNPLNGPQGAFAAYQNTRTAMSLTAGNGGVLVPQWLDPTIVLTNAGANNEVRQVSRVEQVTVDQADFVTSAGVTAEWLAENTESADATPTFSGPTITNYKAAATILASYEVLADSGFDQVAPLVADAFDRLEETAFTSGTGSGQPFGLITRLSGTGPQVAGSSGAAGAADLVVADIYALAQALGPRFRRNANWMSSLYGWNKVRQLNTNSAGSTFWVDFGGGLPPELVGYPVRQNESMDTAWVSGSNDDAILFGDFQQYCITDRVGTMIMYEPIMKGTSGGRPNGQAAWFAFKRTGADVLTSNAFKLLRL